MNISNYLIKKQKIVTPHLCPEAGLGARKQKKSCLLAKN